MKPKTLIITGYGINCEEETAFSFDKAGAETQIVHINNLIEDSSILDSAQILVFPGGFSYGDDTGSGKALANKIKNNLFEDIIKFITKDKLVLGVCNGFQVLVSLGLLPAVHDNYGKRSAALVRNDNNRFECRWVKLSVDPRKCVFTKDLKEMNIPVAHGEGNFYAEDETIKKLKENGQVVFRYTKDDGEKANGEFPHNPNGSIEDIAGICDESGRILGMMPHPERAIFYSNHPEFYAIKEESKRKNEKLPEIYDPAFQVFKNAVNYFKQ